MKEKGKARTIALLGVGASLVGALSLLGALFLPCQILALLAIPFLCAILGMKVPGKALPLAGLSLCMTALLFSFFDLAGFFFYSVPGILGGLLSGFLRKKGVPVGFPLLLGAFVYLGSIYLSVLVLWALAGRSPVEDILLLLGLGGSEAARAFAPLALFLFGASSMGLSLLFFELIAPRIERPEGDPLAFSLGYPLLGMAFGALATGLAWASKEAGYVFLGAALLMAAFSHTAYRDIHKAWAFALEGALLLLSIYGVALLSPLFKDPVAGGLAAGLLPLAISLGTLVPAFYLRRKGKEG